jgi:transcriptional regulator with XRE-family HTH domain
MNGLERIHCATTARILGDLPTLLAAERTRRGLTQRDAAAQIGCNQDMLWRVEAGRPCSYPHARKILIWLAGNAARSLQP